MASYPRHTVPAGVAHNIVAEMSLPDGAVVQVQNVSGYRRNIGFYDDAAAAPDPLEGNEIGHREYFHFTASTDAAAGTWVWGLNGPAVLAVNDDS